MPTGYTAKLMSEGQTFEEFVMLCARAFGALVMMRDDPMDAPIPERFEPFPYYAEQIAKAQSRLSDLVSMSEGEKETFGSKARDDEWKSLQGHLAKEEAQNARLEQMRAQVVAWQPPTPDHQGLRDFMLDQIDKSVSSTSYFTEQLRQVQDASPLSYYTKAIGKAARDIEYHAKAHQEEVERVNTRNEWLRALRESIAGR